MAGLLPSPRALGVVAVLALLAWCPGGAQAKRKPPSFITSPECDALNKALLDAYFRPDLLNGVAFTRPVQVSKCSRTKAEFNETALYDLDNAQRYIKVRLSPTPGPLAAGTLPRLANPKPPGKVSRNTQLWPSVVLPGHQWWACPLAATSHSGTWPSRCLSS